VATGADSGGAKYTGTAAQNSTTGEINIAFDMLVPAGVFLVQGTSEQDMDYTKANLSIMLPVNFDNGEPIKAYIPPGYVTIMFRRIPDDYAGFVNGFVVHPV
jgi:hypothetical protein